MGMMLLLLLLAVLVCALHKPRSSTHLHAPAMLVSSRQTITLPTAIHMTAANNSYHSLATVSLVKSSLKVQLILVGMLSTALVPLCCGLCLPSSSSSPATSSKSVSGTRVSAMVNMAAVSTIMSLMLTTPTASFTSLPAPL